MLASRRNRAVWNVDNPMDDDGFYMYAWDTKSKAPRRRALRRKENNAWRQEARRYLS